MTQKQLLIGGAILLALALGYYFLIYKPNKDKEDGGGESDAAREAQISSIIQRIKSDPAWLASVEQKAISNGVSLDQQLRNDAIFLMENP